MKKILSPFILCLLVVTAVLAQTAKKKEVTAAVESLRKAMIDADKTALENLSAEELSYGHSSGTIEDKATFVGNIVSGKSDFVTINLNEQTIKVTGNTAIVRHKLAGESKSGDKISPINIAVLLIWQKQKGQWKLLARQAVKI